ncbi:hypothetical protein SAY87_008802 [Trapa incisa]|uniref:S-locus receptor kinase C-terminal domain-containing protein n=1 Tax=Trapa incisa TaxID=236973 RepID=A0AAN7Q1D5_9MYRT|nr:hypothetical protein SAY87_008802 [Trapa incisa]
MEKLERRDSVENHPSIAELGPWSEIQRWIHIGLLCVQEDAANRPNMASVVMMTNSFSFSLPQPTAPGFYVESNMVSNAAFVAANNSGDNGPDDSISVSHRGSINEVTMTDIVPR